MDYNTAEHLSNLYKSIKLLNEKIDGLVHDMDIVFTCNEEQAKSIKELKVENAVHKAVMLETLDVINELNDISEDLEERLYATEDTVHDIVDDMCDCGWADGDCEACGCCCGLNPTEDELLTVEEVVKDFKDKHTLRTFGDILKEQKNETVDEVLAKKKAVNNKFYELLDRYLEGKDISFTRKIAIEYLEPYKNDLVEVCSGTKNEYSVFAKIVDATISYDTEPKEIKTICDAMRKMYKEGKSVLYNGWLVGAVDGTNLVIMKMLK